MLGGEQEHPQWHVLEQKLRRERRPPHEGEEQTGLPQSHHKKIVRRCSGSSESLDKEVESEEGFPEKPRGGEEIQVSLKVTLRVQITL
jgi:hypothetical protein